MEQEHGQEHENEKFEPLRAACDFTYLNAHKNEARTFADQALDVRHPEFVQALKIKGYLGDKVNAQILEQAFKFDHACRDEALLYLSKIRIPELERLIIGLINTELERSDPFDQGIYWMIKALKTMDTETARLFLSNLRLDSKIKSDHIATSAFS